MKGRIAQQGKIGAPSYHTIMTSLDFFGFAFDERIRHMKFVESFSMRARGERETRRLTVPNILGISLCGIPPPLSVEAISISRDKIS